MDSNIESLNLFINQLRASPFFEPLSEASLTSLVAQVKQSSYSSGEIIFTEGEPSLGLYWLEAGTLKAVKYSPSGKEQIIHFIEPGQTFNEVGAFTTLPNPASIVALDDVRVWRIPREVIKERIQDDPAFSQLIIDVLSERLRQSVDLIEALSLRPVISRLSRLILDESEMGTFFRPSWYTQYELAARLGTVEDVVQRSLRKLEEDNLIEVSREQIRILDQDGLNKLAD